MPPRSHLSIGEVLSLLREEFSDITISKIRFLESQGLVDPERTPSGYRKFYEHDVERLRWILRQQRENFLPLKVIKGRLSEHEPEAVEQLAWAGGVGAATAARLGHADEPSVVATEPPDGPAPTSRADRAAEQLRAAAPPAPEAPAPRPAPPARQPRPAPEAGAAESSRPAPAAQATTRLETTPPPVPPAAAPQRPVTAVAADAHATASEPAAAVPAGAPPLAAVTPAAPSEAAAATPPTQPDPGPAVAEVPAQVAAAVDAAPPAASPVPEAVVVPAAPAPEPAVAPQAPEAVTAAPAPVQPPAEPAAVTPVATPPPPADPAPAPAAGTTHGAASPTPAGDADADVDSYTAAELAAAAGVRTEDVEALRSFGLLAPHAGVGGTTYYDAEALAVVRLAAAFAGHGVEARHLRAWKTGAEREVSLFEQVIMPLLRQRNPTSRRQAVTTLDELADLGAQLRTILVRQALRNVR